MTERPDHSQRVVVESRDLDTDERDRTVLAASRPDSVEARERELRDLIAEVHPEARFRSFAGDVATALDRQHLVVAHYLGQRPKPPAPQIGSEAESDQGRALCGLAACAP